MTSPLWECLLGAEAKTSAERFSLDHIRATLPAVKTDLKRVLFLSSLIKQLISALKETDFLPLSEDFECTPEGADLVVIDQLSSLKVLLDQLQCSVMELFHQGCFIHDFEQGIVYWHSDDPVSHVKYIWQVGQSSIDTWCRDDESIDQARPMVELQLRDALLETH